jgi:hypothetical protein
MLANVTGWMGAALLCVAPFIIDTDLGKWLAISGLALLCLQAIDKACYNLVCLNVIGIGGYIYALYL